MDVDNSLNQGQKGLEQKETKVNLNTLKSIFLFKKIFAYMRKNKSLDIIKYNKKIQKRLSWSINNYKEYSELFTQIEIEIKPIQNEYGQFINILNKDKSHYHIYFNDSKEEIERNYLKEEDKVTKIIIIIDFQIKSFKSLFEKCKCIESINFKKFYRTNITDMSFMFSQCKSLKELNFSNFKTNNVTDMSFMFYKCNSLKKLNLSNFITNNVTNMSYMFSYCSSLDELNISNFNTDNVNNMSFMFDECSALKVLDISNFNINNVTNINCMFSFCQYELKKKISEQNKNIKVFG